MKGYVDGFVIPMPKKNVRAYQRLASAAGKVWMEHGALEYWECVADQLEMPSPDGKGFMKPFVDTMNVKKGETLFFSYILYRSRKHRDQVNAKVMKDPRILATMKKKMPFDPARMCFGGFSPVVKLK